MKIVCDACQAKYSISDDKVQGKVFKIRCKKCSNIIVVRGGTQAAEAAPAPAEKDTRVYDYGYEGGGAGAAPADDAVWHLVINQEQVGPMTVADVQQRFASGEIDAETFAWREGFGDWLPLSQVDTFSSMVASGGAAMPSGGGGQAAVAAMFGGDDGGGTSRNDPADLFAAASSSSKAAHHEEDDGGDLFGSKPAPAAAAAAAANQKLRGERNENSVLFSLNNLAQLASNSPAPAPVAASSSSSGGAGHATGAAGGEGSGLIDIRSMANAYLGSTGAAKPAASSGIGSIDDLPVFGGGGFSEPAVIMPTVARSSNNKILYVMIGAVGLLAIAAVIMVVILLKGNKNPPAAVAAADKAATDKDTKTDDTKSADTKPSDTAAGSAAAGSGSAAAPTATDTAQGSATQVAANDKQAPVVHNQVAKQPATTPAHTADHTAAPTHNAGVAAAPKAPTGGTPPPKADKPADKTADAGGGCDEVSCVLNNYDGPCCQKFRKGGGGAKPAGGGGGAPAGGGGGAPKASDKPDLDRSMISSAIGAVKGKAMACGDKSSAKGMVKVHVKVDASGHVSSVSVSQTPDPALGACVAAAVQKASFPATSNGGSFSYPFPF